MRRKSAFTLVELLVVIGIIALLMSILLPVMGKAREQSQRVACLSNIRQLGMAMQLYATEYKDAIPVGYIQQKQFSYVVNWNNSNPVAPKTCLMGVLALAGLAKEPKAFYCPAETDPMFSFDTTVNPWPFDEADAPQLRQNGLDHTRFAFNTRPSVDWPVYVSAQTLFPKEMPRKSKLGNKALLADILVTRQFVLNRHKKGINVLYGSWSGQWVALKEFDKTPWKSIPGKDNVSTEFNDAMLRETVEPQQGIWADLDRLSQ